MRVILIGTVARHRIRSAQRPVLAPGHALADFYAKYRTGDIMARATNDLNAVRMMLGPGIMYWTETYVHRAASPSRSCCSVDWRLTLLCLIPAPLVSIAVILFGRNAFTIASK